MRGATNAAAAGGGLKVIASGTDSYGTTFSQPAKYLIVSGHSRNGVITYLLLPGESSSDGRGTNDSWITFAGNGESFLSDAGSYGETLSCSYLALG